MPSTYEVVASPVSLRSLWGFFGFPQPEVNCGRFICVAMLTPDAVRAPDCNACLRRKVHRRGFEPHVFRLSDGRLIQMALGASYYVASSGICPKILPPQFYCHGLCLSKHFRFSSITACDDWLFYMKWKSRSGIHLASPSSTLSF